MDTEIEPGYSYIVLLTIKDNEDFSYIVQSHMTLELDGNVNFDCKGGMENGHN